MADVFKDKAHAYFEYTQPDIALEKFQLQPIIFERSLDDIASFGIQNFPDLDGKSLSLPTVDADTEIIMERAEKMGANVESGLLKEDEKNRLAYCIETLKLPIVLATQIAINRKNLNLDDFTIPDKETEPTIIAMLHGKPGSGKSVFLAAMALKFGYDVFSLDQFSRSSPSAYLEFMKNKGLDSKSSYEEIYQKMAEFRNLPKEELIEKQEARTMVNVLDGLVDKFKDGKRPKIFLIEGVSVKGPGIMSKNIYHFVSELAGEASINVGDASNPDALEKAVNNYFDLEPNILDYGQEVGREFLEKVKMG